MSVLLAFVGLVITVIVGQDHSTAAGAGTAAISLAVLGAVCAVIPTSASRLVALASLTALVVCTITLVGLGVEYGF